MTFLTIYGITGLALAAWCVVDNFKLKDFDDWGSILGILIGFFICVLLWPFLVAKGVPWWKG